MSVMPVSSGGSSPFSLSTPTTQASTASGAANSLGESAFLKLLVAQMQYQDPLQPMDNTQFVTQLATFQTLSELQGIHADLDKLVQAQAPPKAQTKQPKAQQPQVPGS